MFFCRFCGKPTHQEFCDDSCYEEYEEELKVFQDGVREDWPGESRYYDYDDMFPDTEGGL